MAILNEAARRLIDGVNPAVLATLNPDGSPQTSVVWVGRDGDDILISSAAGRRKDRNLQRDPRVSLSVYDTDDPEQYVEVRGTATVAEDPGRALAVALAEKYEKYEGPDGPQKFLDLPPEIIRVVIRLAPSRIAGNV